jgi:membrane associated rhomboid family serine protease
MSFLDQIKEKLKTSSVVDKLVYVLIAVFVIEKLIHTFSFFQNNAATNSIFQLFSLSANTTNIFSKFFTVITYSFLHAGFIHLIFNVIVLYYIGNLFLDYFNAKKLLIYFFLGSLFGGIFFILSYNYFDVFSNKNAYLVGASASITAIMVGLATYIPNYEMHFRFIGFVLTRYIFNLNVASKKKQKKSNKNHLKTVYKKKDEGLSNHQKDRIIQNKIDALLDKISKSGYEALTDTEREFLDSVSKN